MNPNIKNRRSFIWLLIIFIGSYILNLNLGSVNIPVQDVLKSAIGLKIPSESWEFIVQNYRLPKSFTAIIVGSGLGVSGLMMQTLFRNPLAGPFVLGISSGASLGVALVIMGSSLLGGIALSLAISKWGLIIASSLGSFLVLLAVLSVSVRIRDTMAILIIGLMFASITSAVVSVLSYFASAEQLQQYIFWGFGSLGNLSWQDVFILFIVCSVGLILALISVKSLNSLLLGENYAQSLGTNLNRTRTILILATSLLAGTITAFSGPIAFIGLAVPHIARQVFSSSNHQILLPATILIGSIIMLLCDSISQLPGLDYTLPINAITSLFGAPIVIWLLMRKRKMIF